MRHLRGKFTYSNVISTLCLLLLLGGGTAYAATSLAKNSVGAKQIRRNAVNSAKVKNHSLRALDFRPGQLPAGPRGEAGATGAQGPKGDTGPQGPKGENGAPGATNLVVREDDVGPVASEGFYVDYVFCKPGEVATGGGAGFTENGGHEVLQQSWPMIGNKGVPVRAKEGDTPTGWGAIVRNDDKVTLKHAVFYVVCASP